MGLENRYTIRFDRNGWPIRKENKHIVDTRSIIARARFSSFKAAGLLFVVLSRWPIEPGLCAIIPEMEN